MKQIIKVAALSAVIALTQAVQFSGSVQNSIANNNQLAQATPSSAEKAGTAVNLAGACISGMLSNIPPAFCWLGGNWGVIPTGCPSGYFRSLALCYQDCKTDYKFVLGVCWGSCPSGYTDTGALCSRCSGTWWKPWTWHCSTVAKGSYIPSSLTNFDSRIPCPAYHYKGGALCYKDCSVLDISNCGIGGCAASSVSCAATILNMVVSDISAAVNIGLLVASFGTSSAATPAVSKGISTATSKIGESSIRSIAAKAVQLLKSGANAIRSKGTQFAIDQVKGAVVSKVISDYCSVIYDGFANKGNPQTLTIDKVVSAVDIFNIKGSIDSCKKDASGNVDGLSCAANVMTSISVFDPTGLLGATAAFMHPSCDWKIPTPPPNIVWGDPSVQQRAYIVGASYGKMDVTNTVRSKYLAGTFKLEATNAVFGDGWGGIAKSLVVIFHYQGKYYTLYTTENNFVQLPMFNQGTSVTYGSDPLASASTGIAGAAFGPADSTATAQAFLNKGLSSVAATTGNFGDTWGGVAKSMIVVFKRGSSYVTQIVQEGSTIALK